MPIRLNILLSCVVLLSVVVGLGRLERQRAAVGELALNVYERSLTSISLARSAQVGFTRYVADQQGGATASDAQRAAQLKDLRNKLDIVTERAASPETRAMAEHLRAIIVSMSNEAPASRGSAGPATDAAGQVFDRLVDALSADASRQRGDVGTMIAAADQSIGTAWDASITGTVVIMLLLSASISRPLRGVVALACNIAEGRLDNTFNARGRSEVARLSQALSRIQTALVDALDHRGDAGSGGADRNNASEERLSSALRGMANVMEAEATASVERISHQARSIADQADATRQSASRTNQYSIDAAGAGERALVTSQTVASAAEELAASIQEISAQVSQSTEVVGRAVAAGGTTRGRIQALNDTVTRISSVADMIAQIAARTNLLALNATVEAARAGDAGNGFAVVASEVKQLATQTTRSTDEITRYVEEVRVATTASIEAVAVIEQMIGEIDAISSSIAAAVEQQGAATSEIARNVGETTETVTMMHQFIMRVSNEARATDLSAAEVGARVTRLAAATADLKQSLVRVVRSSTGEVNRRVHQRFTVDLACSLTVEGGSPVAGRTVDISEGGAKVTGIVGVDADASGVLTFDGMPIRLPFSVRAVSGDSVRLLFVLDRERTIEWRRILGGIVASIAA